MLVDLIVVWNPWRTNLLILHSYLLYTGIDTDTLFNLYTSFCHSWRNDPERKRFFFQVLFKYQLTWFYYKSLEERAIWLEYLVTKLGVIQVILV